tara:strand:- start:4048 stop:4272 length:225 start_codon:yes stop_codon:yes gene_type:complete
MKNLKLRTLRTSLNQLMATFFSLAVLVAFLNIGNAKGIDAKFELWVNIGLITMIGQLFWIARVFLDSFAEKNAQ